MVINRIAAVIIAIVSGLLCFSCMKAPDAVYSSSLKIDYAIVNNAEVYTINFSGAIRNESDHIAMKNVSGTVVIVDSETKKPVISLPFRLDIILPMTSGVLDLKLEKNDKEISSLLDYLKVDREALVKEGSTSGDFLQENQTRLQELSFEKENIIKLLQGKL